MNKNGNFKSFVAGCGSWFSFLELGRSLVEMGSLIVSVVSGSVGVSTIRSVSIGGISVVVGISSGLSISRPLANSVVAIRSVVGVGTIGSVSIGSKSRVSIVVGISISSRLSISRPLAKSVVAIRVGEGTI